MFVRSSISISQFELIFYQIVIHAMSGCKFCMCSLFRDLAVMKYDNVVCIFYGT